MQTRELYASIELTEDELRLVVGELFMSRLNILKSERVKMSGIENSKIIDKDNVKASIVNALEGVENTLGLKIKSVILCIPSVDVRCVKRRVNVPIGEGSKRIRVSHAKLGLNKAIEAFNVEDYAFVNVGSIKYINGGISSRQIPLDEQAEVLTMDIDLLLANKETVYSFVGVVESAGVRVLDICIDAYSIAEEAALIENSMDSYIILNEFEKNNSILSLFYKGRLIGSEAIGYGYNRFVLNIKRKYRLSYKECLKLLKECSLYEDKEIDESIIYVYMEHDERKYITRKDIYECVIDEFNEYVKTINEMNKPIIESGSAKMVIAGSGADIVDLNCVLNDVNCECETSVYIPEIIGARKGSFTAGLGAIYAHNKYAQLRNSGSCDYEYVGSANIDKSEDKAFTTKLKKILLNNN